LGDGEIVGNTRGTRDVKWMELVRAFVEQSSARVDLTELGEAVKVLESVGGFMVVGR
jgi:hypothetical protein